MLVGDMELEKVEVDEVQVEEVDLWRTSMLMSLR